MALPWKTVDRCTVATEGILELRQRGEADFLITLDAKVLMNSRAQLSERALGRLGCRGHLAGRGGVRLGQLDQPIDRLAAMQSVFEHVALAGGDGGATLTVERAHLGDLLGCQVELVGRHGDAFALGDFVQ